MCLAAIILVFQGSLFVTGVSAALVPAPSVTAPNVLFIVVEGLRLNYGANVRTPAIDRLAKDSAVFTRAYCQQAVCVPSRNSFMSGRRPDTTMVWNDRDHFRIEGKNWSSLPQYFRKHGYFTSGVGKIFDLKRPPNFDPESWSRKFPFRYTGNHPCPGHTAWCIANDSFQPADRLATDVALQRLRFAAGKKKPFFLAVGYRSPQFPIKVLRSVLHSYYPRNDQIPVAKNRSPPKGMPSIAFHKSLQHRYSDLPVHQLFKPFPVKVEQHLRRAYYAAITYMDSELGRLMHELKSQGLYNNTIIVVTADHGFFLGEHNMWNKQMNLEIATKVPLIIHSPKHHISMKSDALVELVDLYPTLVELAGIPAADNENIDGQSLVPLLNGDKDKISDVALSQFPRCCHQKKNKLQQTCGDCMAEPKESFTHMGYSIRTVAYRYTEWVEWDGKFLRPMWNHVAGKELYNHTLDRGDNMDGFENVNVITQYPALGRELSVRLQRAFSK
jgi:iduronate 2-sulfatase